MFDRAIDGVIQKIVNSRRDEIEERISNAVDKSVQGIIDGKFDRLEYLAPILASYSEDVDEKINKITSCPESLKRIIEAINEFQLTK